MQISAAGLVRYRMLIQNMISKFWNYQMCLNCGVKQQDIAPYVALRSNLKVDKIEVRAFKLWVVLCYHGFVRVKRDRKSVV